MKIEPVYDMVLIEIPKAKKTSEGGIVLPGKGESVQSRGVVAAVSRDCRGDISPFIVGDKVIYPEYEGNKIIDGETEYILIKESKILAIYTEEIKDGT